MMRDYDQALDTRGQREHPVDRDALARIVEIDPLVEEQNRHVRKASPHSCRTTSAHSFLGARGTVRSCRSACTPAPFSRPTRSRRCGLSTSSTVADSVSCTQERAGDWKPRLRAVVMASG